MKKYIDADRLIETLNKEKVPFNDNVNYFILNAPASEVSEVRHGRWIYLTGLDDFECSVCGRQMVRNIFDYCPWCGSKMDEEVQK